MKNLIALVALMPSLVFSYTINRNQNGGELRWNNNSQAVYFNPSNSSSLSSGDLSTILSSSASEFSSAGFSISPTLTSGGATSRTNDIYFANDSYFFGGTSVLAITQIIYEGETIIEADIIINDAITFSGTRGVGNYIGDVLTHELGHFSGLGHSQVHGASMLFSLYNGQSTLHEDDLSGVKHLYSASAPEITGTIVGGNNVGVFGSHVMAISTSSGEVKASAISESDGSFIITGLDKLETYYLYTEPLTTLSSLPDYFSSTRKNFCLSETDYRGSFFQSCRRSEEGRPQGISLNGANSINIGSISIGCDLSVPVSYMQNKPSVTNSLNIVDGLGNAGEVVVGHFSENQASNNLEDEYEVNLTNYIVPSGDIYLEIKLVSQELNSPIKLGLSSITETLVIDGTSGAFGLYYDSDGNPDLDLVGRIKLDSTASNNLFKFQVTPEKLINFIVGKGLTIDQFIPNSSSRADDTFFYMMTMSISKKELGVYTKISEKIFRIQDNSTCTDAPRTYSVGPKVSSKSSAQVELEKRLGERDPEILSCGTVGGPSGPSSGLGGFIFTFLLGILAVSSKSLIKI